MQIFVTQISFNYSCFSYGYEHAEGWAGLFRKECLIVCRSWVRHCVYICFALILLSNEVADIHTSISFLCKRFHQGILFLAVQKHRTRVPRSHFTGLEMMCDSVSWQSYLGLLEAFTSTQSSGTSRSNSNM